MNRDTISRQAALDIIDSELNGWLTDDERLHLEGVAIGIECLPTIESKRGKWIEGINKSECSVCGTWWHTDDVFVGDDMVYRFCPNCGARMDL